MKALSSRFSTAGCSAPEETRLSGERVITRVDSFQSTSPSSPLGRTPPNPRGLPLWGQNDWITMYALERRVGQRRGATRAPTQAPEWRGRLRPPHRNQTRRSVTYCGRKMVLTMGSTLVVANLPVGVF